MSERSGEVVPVPASSASPVPADSPPVPEVVATAGFTVRLNNFTGPFDLLLQLIGKHKLDVTEVALHTVTDDFIAYIRAMGDEWDLDETSEFLVVAATLLDLKAARLLPSASVENEEDLALLEVRDLLFARLLQYKAFKEAAAHIAGLESIGSRRYPRAVGLEPQYAEALPDLVLGIGPDRLAKLAVKAFTPKPVPVVSIAHIHMVRVSVREHAAILRDRLVDLRSASFQTLCLDCESTLEVVARFLALLELYREGLVEFAQVQALGELMVNWTGTDDAGVAIQVEEYEGAPAEVAPSPTEPQGSPLVDADAEPSSAEPSLSEPDVAEPSPVEPSPVEPSPVEPSPAEPVVAEPEAVEPEAVDVALSGPGLADGELDADDPAFAEPEGAEPEGAEPEGAEPEGAEPEGAEPAAEQPAESGAAGPDFSESAFVESAAGESAVSASSPAGKDQS